MSERFLQLNIEKDEQCEADFLAINHPHAFILLYFIARRARRYDGHSDGLTIGMAKIGDWEKLGLSRQNYRTALKVLTRYKFLEILETNRTRKKSTTGSTTEGTLVRLLDSRVWDINSQDNNHRPNHCLTTAQPLPNHELRKKKKEEEEEEYIAQSAPPLRNRNENLFFNSETLAFEGISLEDRKDWSVLYPNVDLDLELKKATEWLKSNPSKSNKKLWRKFLTGWFARTNDHLENKKAFKDTFKQSSTDRRTKNMDGTPITSKAENLF